MFYQHKPHAGHWNHPQQRWNGPVCCCMMLFAASALQCIMQQNGPYSHCRGWWQCTARILSLVTLTLDTDIQTRQSEEPNMSSVWIWCKSIQRFQKYMNHKQTNKKVTDSAKTRTVRSLLRAVLCNSAKISNLQYITWQKCQQGAL